MTSFGLLAVWETKAAYRKGMCTYLVQHGLLKLRDLNKLTDFDQDGANIMIKWDSAYYQGSTSHWKDIKSLYNLSQLDCRRFDIGGGDFVHDFRLFWFSHDYE